MHGGAVQGIGQALMEHAVYDPGFGQLLTASFNDYALLRARDRRHSLSRPVMCRAKQIHWARKGREGTPSVHVRRP